MHGRTFPDEHDIVEVEIGIARRDKRQQLAKNIGASGFRVEMETLPGDRRRE